VARPDWWITVAGRRDRGRGPSSGSCGSLWALVAGVLGSGAGLGCTDFADGADELLPSDSTVVAPLGDEWGCLAEERPPSPTVPVDRNRPLSYRGAWLDLGTREAPPNLRARACGIADPACSAPLTAFIAADSSGVIELPLFHGFAGYLEITSDVTVPTVAFFASTLTANTSTVFDEPLPRTLIQPAALVGLAEVNGIQVEPTAGYVVMFALNCSGRLTENVEFALDNQDVAVRYYFANNFPSITLEATTTDGMGGFVNVPGGAATVSATRVNTGELVRTATFFVRPGWGSSIVLGPYASSSGG
jgi:hypothetical protein